MSARINLVVSDADMAWLRKEAESGPYAFPSTLARFILAEAIAERKKRQESNPRDESVSEDKSQ